MKKINYDKTVLAFRCPHCDEQIKITGDKLEEFIDYIAEMLKVISSDDIIEELAESEFFDAEISTKNGIAKIIAKN